MLESRVIGYEIQGVIMEKCDQCGNSTTALKLEWNSNDGWRGVCHDCRLVPTFPEPGRFTFIRVGGK